MQTTPRSGGNLQHTPLRRNTILLGDVGERLRELPDASADCIVTSPPYFGVRNYGHDQQFGAEATIHDWVADRRRVCQELARVLRPTGSLWLVFGDTYAQRPGDGATRKSLLLGPVRLALALVRDGWLVRNQVIWAKSNPMPSSVPDRLSGTRAVGCKDRSSGTTMQALRYLVAPPPHARREHLLHATEDRHRGDSWRQGTPSIQRDGTDM
jgi:hypothetical protein